MRQAYPSWPGLSRPSTSCLGEPKTWMPGSSPGMTKRESQLQRMHGEPVVLVGPACDRTPAGALGQRAEGLHRVFVGILGVDGFAGAEFEGPPRHRDGLVLQAFEVHFD